LGQCRRKHAETGKKAARLQLGAFGTRSAYSLRNGGFVMLYWAAVFFIIALLAAVFGFGGIAASAAGAAKILFIVFLILAVVSLIFGRRVPT
jgi:uncharacterized membrane protein YtjA (UPF0391 family)